MIDSVSLSRSLRTPGLDFSNPNAAAPTPAADFTKVLENLVSGGIETLRAGETAAISGLRGALPLQDVVDAVMSAERSLQTALALRDKVVGAYQEISRMSI